MDYEEQLKEARERLAALKPTPNILAVEEKKEITLTVRFPLPPPLHIEPLNGDRSFRLLR